MSKEIPEILLLSNDTRPDAAYILANSIWFHYHKSPDRAWIIWDNTFAVLRVQAKRGSSTVTHCMLAFASLTSIDGMAWTNMTHTLLHLAVQGVLATTTVLKGLVYPLRSHALASGMGECEVYLRVAHDISRPVLSNEEEWGNDIVELQRVRVRRQDVLCAPHFSHSYARVPRPPHVPPERRPRTAALRDADLNQLMGI